MVGDHGNLVDAGVGLDNGHPGVGRREPGQPGVLEVHADGEIDRRLGQVGQLPRLGLVGMGVGPGRDHHHHVGPVAGDLLEKIRLGRDADRGQDLGLNRNGRHENETQNQNSQAVDHGNSLASPGRAGAMQQSCITKSSPTRCLETVIGNDCAALPHGVGCLSPSPQTGPFSVLGPSGDVAPCLTRFQA